MRGVLLGAGFVVCWSSGFIGAALASTLAPGSLLAWRYLITGALLIVWSSSELRRLSRREIGQQAVLGVVAHVIFLGGVFGATARGVPPGTTALICALQPLVVAVAGRIFWRDRLSLTLWGSLALGLAAVGLTVGGPAIAGGSLLLPTAALLGLSGSALLERRWAPTTSVAAALAVQVACAALVFVGFASVTSGLALELDTTVIVALGWLVVLSGIGGYGTYIGCLRHLGATVTSGLLYLTPALTAVWAWAMFGSALSPHEWAGLGVSLTAVALMLGGRHGRSPGPMTEYRRI